MLKTFPGDTDCVYIYMYMGLWSNYNCSRMNPMMHRQTDYSYFIAWILHVDLLQRMICSHNYLSK